MTLKIIKPTLPPAQHQTTKPIISKISTPKINISTPNLMPEIITTLIELNPSTAKSLFLSVKPTHRPSPSNSFLFNITKKNSLQVLIVQFPRFHQKVVLSRDT